MPQEEWFGTFAQIPSRLDRSSFANLLATRQGLRVGFGRRSFYLANESSPSAFGRSPGIRTPRTALSPVLCPDFRSNLWSVGRASACSGAVHPPELGDRVPNHRNRKPSSFPKAAQVSRRSLCSRRKLRRHRSAWFQPPDAHNANRLELIEAVVPP